jgi:hypothetical protein
MKKVRMICLNILFIFVSSCSQINGFQISSGMSDAEIEEEAHSGQMRNIR